MKKSAIVLGLGLVVFGFDSHAQPATQAETAKAEPIKIEVYRSASCGCCGKWVEHLKANNFAVQDNIVADVQLVKDKYGVHKEIASCHTALVNGYVIEGHVPANDIEKLLKLKPKVVGIAVPAMPSGTPGMEMGDKKDSYNVISFDKDQHYQVFTHYEEK